MMSCSFFSIDVCDEDTGLLVHEIYLEDVDDRSLPDVLRHKMLTLGANQSELLSSGDLEQYLEQYLAQHSELRHELSQWPGLPVRIRHDRSEVGYRIHGGRELDLMTKGLKPLSVFSHVDPASGLASFLRRYFDPLVDASRLISGRIADEEFGSGFMAPAVMYALPSEAWRIQAYRLLADSARMAPWNDALEFTQGFLLGYTREQNDIWLGYRKRMGWRWGVQAMYRPVSERDIERFREFGKKAFMESVGQPIRFYLPYHSDAGIDPESVLLELEKRPLAKFYLYARFYMDFSKCVVEHSGIKFEVFELPISRLADLNEAIDGVMDIRGLHDDA